MKQTLSQQQRLNLMPWLIVAAFTLIFLRLFHLQIRSFYTHFQLSKRNYLRLEKITPPRGNILDCHGTLIATNRPIIQIMWRGSNNKKFEAEQITILEKLEALFQKELLTNQELLKAEQRGKSLVLLEDVSFENLSRILELFPRHKNLVVQTTFKRFYPHQRMSCHVLGYLSGMSYEPTGEMGLEKIFDNTLRGTPGQMVTTINSIGRQLRHQEIQRAFNGENLHTTLDGELYALAEKAFPAECSGSFIIMDARTGALRVLLSQPTFDPNLFLQPLTSEQWHTMQKNQPFLNRALAGHYPPASLFKLITIISALEQRIITEDTRWCCTGSVEFCKRHYHCKNRTGHGMINTEEALVQSCNVPFYEIGKKIKIDILAHYAHMFGLGEKTTSLLPERSGLIPTSQWKRKTFGKPWWPGETLSAVIGQSYMLVTPLQICRMINSICEGILVTPRILQQEPVITEPIAVSSKTLQFMRNAMKQVIHHGTGQRLRSLKNITIHGKTGTAQVRGLAKNSQDDTHDEHGWFAAHVQYKNHDPFVLVILVEHIGSALFSVDIAKNFLKDYCKYLDGKTN